MSQDISPVVISLRDRANTSQRFANYSLIAAICFLVVGILIFVFAGTIANYEQKTLLENMDIDAINKMQLASLDAELSIVRKMEEFATEKDARVDTLFQKYGVLKSPSAPGASTGNSEEEPQPEESKLSDKDRKDLKELLAAIQTRNAILNSPNSSTGRTSEIDNEMMAPLIEKLLEAPKETIYANVAASLSTRIGALIALLFIAQILVPIHRYYARMATYNNNLADALEYYPESNLNELAESFASISAEKILFGDLPVNPIVQAIKNLKVG